MLRDDLVDDVTPARRLGPPARRACRPEAACVAHDAGSEGLLQPVHRRVREVEHLTEGCRTRRRRSAADAGWSYSPVNCCRERKTFADEVHPLPVAQPVVHRSASPLPARSVVQLPLSPRRAVLQVGQVVGEEGRGAVALLIDSGCRSRSNGLAGGGTGTSRPNPTSSDRRPSRSRLRVAAIWNASSDGGGEVVRATERPAQRPGEGQTGVRGAFATSP